MWPLYAGWSLSTNARLAGSTLLIEPKPQGQPNIRYDYDASTVYGFLETVRRGKRDQTEHPSEPRDAGRSLRSIHEIADCHFALYGTVWFPLTLTQRPATMGWDTDQFEQR